MSWRSVIDFDGLTSDEIFARLFLWWFGPQFAVFFFALPGRPTEFLTSIGYLGVLLTALVVWRDADGVGIERPWMWALLAGLVPLLGWWAYGRRRASGSTRDIR